MAPLVRLKNKIILRYISILSRGITLIKLT